MIGEESKNTLLMLQQLKGKLIEIGEEINRLETARKITRERIREITPKLIATKSSILAILMPKLKEKLSRLDHDIQTTEKLEASKKKENYLSQLNSRRKKIKSHIDELNNMCSPKVLEDAQQKLSNLNKLLKDRISTYRTFHTLIQKEISGNKIDSDKSDSNPKLLVNCKPSRA